RGGRRSAGQGRHAREVRYHVEGLPARAVRSAVHGGAARGAAPGAQVAPPRGRAGAGRLTMGDRVVVTGIGVISPFGVGRDAFWDGLVQGRLGVSPRPGLEALPEAYRYAGQLHEFRPEDIIGTKGLKYLNDATRLLLCTAELARRDAGLEIAPDVAEDVGVVVASSFSNVGDCVGFYETLLSPEERTTPLRFPTLFIKLAGGNQSIPLRIRGLNATGTNGATSSLDALQHGLPAVRCGRAGVLLVGGLEVLSPPLVEGFWQAGMLGDTMRPRPFDRRRRGLILGEGCGV